MKNSIIKVLKSKFFISSVIIVLLAITGFWYYSSSNSDKKVQYKFVKVDQGDLVSVVSSTGTLNAVTTVQIGTQVSGTIARILVDFNKKVHKGQLLAMLDTTLLSASVRDAQNAYEKAVAQYEYSQKDFKRADGLFKKNLASQSDYDLVEYNLKNAKTSMRSAKANLDKTKINLNYAYVTTPISGTVIARNVDVGQTVASSFSAPVLFLIANDLSKMQILANVDESDIGQIQEGCKVKFSVQSYPNRKFEGVTSQIRLQPTTIQNVVNYTVVVDVSNKDNLLLPGMTATIDFLLESASDVIRVPNSALRLKPSEDMINEVKPQLEEQIKDLPDSTKQKIMQRLTGVTKKGQGGFSGGGGSKKGAATVHNKSAFLWYLDANGKLNVAQVKTGITDGQLTEILPTDKIKPGMQVINGVIEKTDKKSSSPLQQTPTSGSGPGGRI